LRKGKSCPYLHQIAGLLEMASRNLRSAVLLWLVPLVLGVPAPVPAPTLHVNIVARQPVVTTAPRLVYRSPDIFDDVGSYVGGVISSFGSGVSSFVASGVPQYFQGLPVGDDVKKSAGVSDDDLDAKPTQVLNVP
jgi:hypothetical protein